MIVFVGVGVDVSETNGDDVTLGVFVGVSVSVGVGVGVTVGVGVGGQEFSQIPTKPAVSPLGFATIKIFVLPQPSPRKYGTEGGE